MLRIGICDDEPEQVLHISSIVSRHLLSRPHVFQQFGSAEALLLLLDSNAFNFDIMLLDIQLNSAVYDGISIAKLIHSVCPLCQIIFMTGHLQYVSAVYEVEHAYFVLKDNLEFWLPKALDKASLALATPSGDVLHFQRSGKTFLLPQADIIYCERSGRTTLVVTAEQVYETPDKLETLLLQLPSPQFIRCHKSFFVHAHYIKQFSVSSFELTTQILIPISRTYAETVKCAFHLYLGTLL